MNQLIWIKNNLITVIPVTMILGYFFGINTDTQFLKVTIIPLTFLMVYPMLINLQIKKIFERGDTAVQIATQVINFFIIPFMAFGIGQYFFPENHYLALGLLLTGLLPTSGMTISWTGMAKGNMPAAVKMTVFGLLLGSFLSPIYLELLMGAEININLINIFKQIIIIIFIPLVLGNITQRFLIYKYGLAHYNEKLKKNFSPFSTLGVIGIVFVAMALKAKGIMSNPTMLLNIILPLVLFYLLNTCLSILTGKIFFKRSDAIALLYGTVMRNLSIALAISMTAFGSEAADIALVIALGYIIQVQLAAWVVKLTTKIYGPAGEETGEQILHKGLFALHSTDNLKNTAKLLSEEKIHSVTILDKDEKPMGILTLRGILNYIADGMSLDTQLKNLKFDPLITVNSKLPVTEIAKTMKRTHEYKILLIGNKGEIKGIVTGHDILKSL